MPSIAPSHAGPAPIDAKNAGRTAVAVSWLQSLNKLVSPTPKTVRLSQDFCLAASVIVGEGGVIVFDLGKIVDACVPDYREPSGRQNEDRRSVGYSRQSPRL